jgi:hypothetical protein
MALSSEISTSNHLQVGNESPHIAYQRHALMALNRCLEFWVFEKKPNLWVPTSKPSPYLTKLGTKWGVNLR